MPCYNREGCWDKIGAIFCVAWVVYNEAVLSLLLLCLTKWNRLVGGRWS